MRIYVGMALTDSERTALAQAVGPAEVIHSDGKSDAGLKARFLTCDACFGRVPLDWLPESKQLRWMQLDSVGFDDLAKLDWQTLGERIKVTNLYGFFADPVAQTMLAGLLALYRGVDELAVLRQAQRWAKMEVRPNLRLLTGAHVLLVGYGTIAQRFESLLAPFNCRIERSSRTLKSGLTQVELDAALRKADVVCCTLPETAQTKGFFDRRRIGMLKRDAIFINVGRGGVVDEDALAQALVDKRIAGAVLDVTTVEPLPSGHPFWNCPNLILTQHTGGGTTDENLLKIQAFANNVQRYRDGQPLVGIVQWDRGY